jgi:GNAT superfamily N-acetyltransferase
VITKKREKRSKFSYLLTEYSNRRADPPCKRAPGHMKRSKHSSAAGQRFTVRQARLRDLEILIRHRRKMWEDLGMKSKTALARADRVYGRWASSRLNNKTLVGWVAESEEGTAVGSGCIWMRPTQPRPNHNEQLQPYLMSMYTEPRFRRKNVASSVVKEAIKWCRKNGYTRLMLHASKYGRNVYRKQGFSRGWEMRINLERKSR